MLALTIQCLLNANGALKKNKGDRNLQTEILNWKAEIRQFPQVMRMCPWIKISRSSKRDCHPGLFRIPTQNGREPSVG